jgi:hypothetical protein
MKIRLTENQVTVKPIYKEGNIERMEEYHHPLRSWDLDIDSVSLKEVWLGIKGDVRELIHLAKNSLR